jgi:hypothetical protein
VLVFANETGAGMPMLAMSMDTARTLSFDTLDGNDRLIIDASSGNAIPARGISFVAGAGDDALAINALGALTAGNVSLVEYQSGTGTNTLTIQGGSGRVDATVAAGGTLNTTVASASELLTHRLRQNGLALSDGARVVILPDGTDNATSVLTNLLLDPGATLDINDNALVVNYSGASPEAAIRDWIIEGRGRVGIGSGTWAGTGIISSFAVDANLANPESRSIGYANNGGLPLGPYATFRGQPLDATSIVITYTVTGDANLDGKVDDNDVTITGASYGRQSAPPNWALGDFDYNGIISDDDITLIGALYKTDQVFSPSSPLPAPLRAAGDSEARDAVFAAAATPEKLPASMIVDSLVTDPRDRLTVPRTALSDNLTALLAHGRRRNPIRLGPT